MKNKLLPFICLTLILSSCSNIQVKVNNPQDDGFDVELMKDVRAALVEANPQVVVSYDNEHSYDFQSELSNQTIADNGSQNAAILEVERNYTFDIAINEGIPYHIWDHEILYKSSINYVRIVNQYNEIIPTEFSHVDRNNNIYTISPLSLYEYDMVYTATIYEDKPFHFVGKDESIKKITFKIESENPTLDNINNVSTISDIVSINLRDCQDSEESASNHGNYVFEYYGNVLLNINDVFLASDVLGVTDKNSFYGKVISITNRDKYKLIEYEPANANDVFTQLNIDEKDEPVNLTNAEVALTEQVVKERFATNEETQKLVYAIAREAKADKYDILDWLSHASLNVNLGIKNNTFTFTININWAGIFKEEILFNVNVGYEYKETLTSDFKARIATKYKVIPIGVDYKLKLVEDSYSSFTIKIDFSRGVSPMPDADKIREGIFKRIGEAEDGLVDYKSIFAQGDHAAKVDGDGNALIIPLLRVDIDTFYPVSFRVEIDIVIEISIKVAFVFQYTSHKKTVVFSFSNEQGAENVTNETLEESSEIDVSFYGQFKAEVGLKVKFAVYLLGFYKYLHVEFFIHGYVGFQITGMAIFHWDLDPNSQRTFDASASFDFKIYLGAKWGYDVRFLFFHLSDSFNFAPDKVLYGYRTGERIIEAKPPTTNISIDDNGLDLGASNYLLYDVFEPNKFAVSKAKLIKPTSVVEKEYGILVNNPTTSPMLSFRFTDNSGNPTNYLRLVGDRLSVNKDAPIDFTCKMIVTSLVGNASETTFNITCHCDDLRDIYFDDVYAYSVRNGATITLPTLDISEEIIDDQTNFAYFWLPEGYSGESGSDYYSGLPGGSYDLSKLAAGDVNFVKTPEYKHYYLVDFFTSTGLHIKTVRVEMGQNLSLNDVPSIYECERNMPGYRFIGWDIGYDNLTTIHDMKVVTGLYVKENS